MAKQFQIIDLFCGCGGFGLGAELAGFNSLAAIDIDTTLQSAYKKNFPKTKVIQADLSKLEYHDWISILNGKRVDGVIGGPPCQGFSRIGKNDVCDERRSLLRDYFRHVKLLKPKFFIMENVEGILDKKNISELLEAINIIKGEYKVIDPFVINSADIGAPTQRKRVLVIGYLPDYIDEMTLEDFIPKTKKRTTVRDAIIDLPEPIDKCTSDDQFGWAQYKLNNQSELSSYAKKLRKPPQKNLGWSISKKMLNQNQVSGFFITKHTEPVRRRYISTPQGSIDKVSKSKKLEWEGFCPTLRAGTGADKGSYQAVRPLHPTEGRVITVREAARLQGFPDWFVFHNTKWHSFRMIGNSVSPIVSEYILKIIKKKIIVN